MTAVRNTTLGVAVSLLILGGCTRNEHPAPGDTSNASTAQASIESPAAASDTGLVELAVAQEDAQPLPLAAGETVSGEFAAPKAGQLIAMSLFIGNYAGSSDGELRVEACQGDKCAEGKASVVGSQDNAYLEFTLGNELALQSGRTKYSVAKIGGANVVALWTYSNKDGATSFRSVDGSPLPRSPKIALRFAQ